MDSTITPAETTRLASQHDAYRSLAKSRGLSVEQVIAAVERGDLGAIIRMPRRDHPGAAALRKLLLKRYGPQELDETTDADGGAA